MVKNGAKKSIKKVIKKSITLTIGNTSFNINEDAPSVLVSFTGFEYDKSLPLQSPSVSFIDFIYKSIESVPNRYG